ncbi:MAG: hypothetical protein RR050_00230 [Bacilli bacterium]
MMKDPRICIRLTKEQHKMFKMIAINMEKSMQQLLKEYVETEIKKEDVKNENKKN